jgi:hypothetical protein
MAIAKLHVSIANVKYGFAGFLVVWVVYGITNSFLYAARSPAENLEEFYVRS